MFYPLFQDVRVVYVAATLAVLLSTFAFLPYAIDTIKGHTQPQRASWLIWSVLSTISLGSQIAEGATQSLAFAAIQVFGTIAIFTLSIWKGKGTFLRGPDAIILLIASYGVVLWMVTQNSIYALTIAISISLLGGICTVRKAYNDPDSETLCKWAINVAASLCAIVAVGGIFPALLAYPVYLLVLNGAVVSAILLGRGQVRGHVHGLTLT